MTDARKLAAYTDHTLLKPESTWKQVRAVCDEAAEWSAASVCISPVFVKSARAYLKDRARISTVIGFPHGCCETAVKVYEARLAVDNGADELDMVINIGALKEGDLGYVSREIGAVREACAGKVLKVIIETCLLTREEKLSMCRVVTDTGADFIKTSTGFSTGGATFEDVRLLAENVGEGVRVKASGGISTLRDAEEFIRLGASRLGTSRVIGLLKKAGYD